MTQIKRRSLKKTTDAGERAHQRIKFNHAEDTPKTSSLEAASSLSSITRHSLRVKNNAIVLLCQRS